MFSNEKASIAAERAQIALDGLEGLRQRVSSLEQSEAAREAVANAQADEIRRLITSLRMERVREGIGQKPRSDDDSAGELETVRRIRSGRGV